MWLIKIAILALIIIGAFLTIRASAQKACPPPKVVYKYIPQSLKEAQMDPTNVSRLFDVMFEEGSTWDKRYITEASTELVIQPDPDLNEEFVIPQGSA